MQAHQTPLLSGSSWWLGVRDLGFLVLIVLFV